MTVPEQHPSAPWPELAESELPASPQSSWWQEALAGLCVLLTIAGLGVPLGVLWSALSPRVLVQMTADGPVLTDAEPEEYAGADVVFLLLGIAAGIGLGLLCWLLVRRWRGPVVLIGLTIGSLAGACLAWQLGRRIGLSDYIQVKTTAQIGWQFYRPPTMSSGAFVTVFGLPLLPRGALAAQALTAVFTYTMLAGWSRLPSLRPDRSEATA